MLIILLEAAVVGVAIAVLGSIVGFAMSAISARTTGRRWSFWIMIVSLFTTGAVAHLLFEVAGLNAYYVSYKK